MTLARGRSNICYHSDWLLLSLTIPVENTRFKIVVIDIEYRPIATNWIINYSPGGKILSSSRRIYQTVINYCVDRKRDAL